MIEKLGNLLSLLRSKASSPTKIPKDKRYALRM